MEPYTIQPATAWDVPVLMIMIRELVEYEHLQNELKVTESSLQDALFGPSPVASALMGLMGGEPAGYAVYYRTFSTFVGRPGVFLEDLYVRPGCRRKGLGRALMEDVVLRGMRGGQYGRYEWLALRWNDTALRFYQNMGAQPLEEWVFVRMNGDPLRRLAEGVL
jgi:GNAT superfamily N-acetyltransferase